MKQEQVTVHESGDQIYTMSDSGVAMVWTVGDDGVPVRNN